MIDVTGRTDDHGAHSASGSVARRSASALSSAVRPFRAALRSLREFASTRAGADEPCRREHAVARNASPEEMRGAEHRLTVGVATCGGFGPPGRRGLSIAIDAKCIVMDHAEARHRRRNALLGGAGPPMRLDRVEEGRVGLQQHPTQHVLSGAVASFSRPIDSAARALSCSTPSPLKYSAARFRRATVSPVSAASVANATLSVIALDAKAFGEACANIVLRAAYAACGQRSPDG